MENTAPRRPRGWPLRFYEGVVRLGGSLPDGEGATTLGPAPAVYDVDPVVAYLSSVEEWADPAELPAVEPPPSRAGRALADFVLPDATAARSQELRREGAMAQAEEWIEEGVGDRPRGDAVGCVFSPAGGGERLARLTRRHPEATRAWRAVVTLAGWEPSTDGGAVLREKQTYDWLVGVTEGGALRRRGGPRRDRAWSCGPRQGA